MGENRVRRISLGICCAGFVLFILVMSFLNRSLPLEQVSELLRGQITPVEARDGIREEYASERLRWTDDFVTLNGGYARLTGRSRYNEVQRMNNGMLTFTEGQEADLTAFADNLSGLQRFLTDQGIPFLFVMAPAKVPLNGEGMPRGTPDNYENTNADQAMRLLSDRGVQALDLRQTLSATLAQVEENFYRTDHHWNVTGSLKGYRQIMENVERMIPEVKAAYTDPACWEKREKPDWWLGTHGKRVGRFFAGTDALTWALPTFETRMSRVTPGYGFYRGSFEQTEINAYVVNNRDYMQMDGNRVYVGADYPLSLHRNPSAPNPQKVLLLKDSFMIPLQAYFATEFAEVDALDPRYFKECSVAEYVAMNPPDLVIMMVSKTTLAHGAYADFGTGAVKGFAVRGETVYTAETAEIPAEGDAAHALPLPVKLENGKYYELKAEAFTSPVGSAEGANVTLRNPVTGEDAMGITFNLADVQPEGYRWAFRVPEEGDCVLTLHSGMDDWNDDNRLIWQGVSVTELIL